MYVKCVVKILYNMCYVMCYVPYVIMDLEESYILVGLVRQKMLEDSLLG